MEKKLDELNDTSSQAAMHAAISEKTEGEIIIRANNDKINDMLRDNLAPEEEIQPNKDFETKKISSVTEEVLELGNDTTSTATIDIDDKNVHDTDAASDAVNDAASDAVNDGVSDGVSDGVNHLVSPPEISLEEIESGLVDPDEPQGDDKEFNNMLVKKRDYQSVVKKD
jgi:hypothetical protein